MFAVPGWSVSADSLKVETVSKNDSTPGAKPRKRKRAGASASEPDVTSSNVADLWSSVVEGNEGTTEPSKEGKPSKRQKKAGEVSKKKGDGEKSEVPLAKPAVDAKATPGKKDKKDKKEKKKEKSQPSGESQGGAGKKATKGTAEASSKAIAPTPQLPAASKLTPLQASMREKLISARFRHLNETLYTRPSEEAFGLFQESPEMFEEYHEGFRRQVKVWPENPVDTFLRDIRTRGKVKPAGKGKPNASQVPLSKTVLPRTMGTCHIADLGCGDARLAQSLQSDKGKLRLQVHSFDLQSPSPLVTKADIANLPLEDGSVNVAIFCLALMGTNWVDFVEEAYRILHWKGELWVAEIKSRFGPVRNKNAPVAHSIGRRKANAGKKQPAENAADLDEDLSVEVDGVEDRRRETDVSSFVEVLKKRGFVLQGERQQAVDLSNKMFVKMHFIKGASPTKGKGVNAQESGKPIKRSMSRREALLEADETEENEASILKPCVYKIR
ncbi:unnamed protein product [Clonostachys rosea]|uniref:Ribosomal RNA-processing protein 8 n=1 Tax=Bionectria ochroleuca TaxID=29856 RepID=A0ABY6TYX7_BIOOC|nr:unnamed protein product [Clonostachys rosea]